MADTHPSDPYTMEARLCDDQGVISDELIPGRDISYLQLLNRLRSYSCAPPVVEPTWPCTGHAHLAGQHIRCTSPAHLVPRVVASPTWVVGRG